MDATIVCELCLVRGRRDEYGMMAAASQAGSRLEDLDGFRRRSSCKGTSTPFTRLNVMTRACLRAMNESKMMIFGDVEREGDMPKESDNHSAADQGWG